MPDVPPPPPPPQQPDDHEGYELHEEPQPEPQAGATPPPPPPPSTGDGGPTGAATPPTGPEQPMATSSDEERMWALACHLAILAGFIPAVPVIGGVVGPLIIWLIKRDEMPLVNDQGKEALNFSLSVLIVSLILTAAGTFAMLLGPLACLIWPVVTLLGFGLMIAVIVYAILAGIEAQKGVRYRYPYCWRLIQ